MSISFSILKSKNFILLFLALLILLAALLAYFFKINSNLDNVSNSLVPITGISNQPKSSTENQFPLVIVPGDIGGYDFRCKGLNTEEKSLPIDQRYQAKFLIKCSYVAKDKNEYEIYLVAVLNDSEEKQDLILVPFEDGLMGRFQAEFSKGAFDRSFIYTQGQDILVSLDQKSNFEADIASFVQDGESDSLIERDGYVLLLPIFE